ncbi:DUF1659 domain-containing protein [Liquorilactobacillus uvarum]|uniref:DUF1659 domain-containing protein n=1 Tax=Liquorilactobacillus uvarum DSM 19971 TaxID=1423812 RepID=A0A0R1Q5K1_9LACO|nr:DUF1659 domain-containing protein [Liquorilactobacillus uvarum]KRL37474.1 hypothetical protein FD20_GL000350 [Liquorilactobacillus uvarum DSM 19971]
MSTTWIKTSLNTVSVSSDGEKRKRSFNNIKAAATDQEIVEFGKILSLLTGTSTDELKLTTVNDISA